MFSELILTVQISSFAHVMVVLYRWFVQLRVSSPSHLSFAKSVPSAVSNIEEVKYEFPIIIANMGNETELGSTVGQFSISFSSAAGRGADRVN